MRASWEEVWCRLTYSTVKGKLPIHLKKRISATSAYLLLLLCVAGMACDSDTPATPEDQAACAQPNLIDFRVVTVGSSEERTFEIENTGGGTLSGAVSVLTSAPCDGYSIVSGGGAYNLTSGQIHTVTVRLESASIGVKSCRIDTGNSLCGDVGLTGTVEVVTACVVQPAIIDLGVVTVGSEIDTSFTITNTGGGVLSGTVTESCEQVSIVSGGGNYHLSANTFTNIWLRICPTENGAFTCTVNTGNELCGDVTVSGITESARIAGTIVGHGGTILRTLDGGASWTPQNSETSAILIDVQFFDRDMGVTVGQSGTILKTSDGGTTWASQNSGTIELLMAVSFTDQNTGTVAGQNGTILRTTDGGATWNSQISGKTNHLIGVSFVDQNTGTVVGWNGVILRTTNGGATWVSQDSGTLQFFSSVCFVDANTGTAVTAGAAASPAIPQIHRTTDGGNNWTLQMSIPSGGIGFNAVTFIDANTGTVVGSGGVVYRTTNGGDTWSPQNPGTEFLSDIAFVDANVGVAVGFGGVIVLTNDGGDTWVPRTSGTSALLRGISLVRY